MSFKSEIPLMSDAKISGTAINFRSFTKMVPMGLIQLAIKSPPPEIDKELPLYKVENHEKVILVAHFKTNTVTHSAVVEAIENLRA